MTTAPLYGETVVNHSKISYTEFQFRAARVITGASHDVRSTDILTTLSWETLDNRRKKSKAVYMYKVLNDHAAPGLKESFHGRNVTQNTYNLRNSEYDLTIPKPRTEYNI